MPPAPGKRPLEKAEESATNADGQHDTTTRTRRPLMKEFPRYMNKDSSGPHVTILQAFLIGTGFGIGIAFDGDYGRVTAESVVRFQVTFGLEADGHFGPATRRAAKRFDFQAACRAT